MCTLLKIVNQYFFGPNSFSKTNKIKKVYKYKNNVRSFNKNKKFS